VTKIYRRTCTYTISELTSLIYPFLHC